MRLKRFSFQSSTKEVFAIAVGVFLISPDQQNALNEVRILASINDPNVIRYKQAFYDSEERCLCIVMDFADGGDLYTKIANQKKIGKGK